jgi:ATP-dependent helicase/nuclease subunit A
MRADVYGGGMKPLTIISASAGTGKTHRLATLLSEEVSIGAVNPDCVVATTFTNKAAAELKERVRAHLLKAGRKEEAERLAFARIGTVNSICGALLSEHAFDLGISPDLSVLDDAQSELAQNRALSMVLQQGEADELAQIGSRIKDLDWQEDVRRIVNLARSNNISPAELLQNAHRSKEGLLALFGSAPTPELEIEKELKAAVAVLITQAQAKAKTRGKELKGAAEKAERLQKISAILQAGDCPPWSEWRWLSDLSLAADLKDEVEPVKAIAATHERHAQLHADCARAIELVFGIAANVMGAYQDYKRAHGLIDFIDQEVQALDLLQRKEVRAKLQDEIDLILVDEFQDTSPLQLAIFLSLAGLARVGNYWVGDQKQAIFGFRETDPALMDEVISVVLGGKEPETLTVSRRSRPALVHLTSDLFSRAFIQDQLPRGRVAITPYETEDDPALGAIVEQWSLSTTKNEDDDAAIAAGVKLLLDQKDQVLVRDTRQKRSRAVRPSDIAVLCRTNTHCKEVARALKNLSLHAVVASDGLLTTPEARLVLAGLRYWIDPDETLAAAELLRLTEYGAKPNEFLEDLLTAESKCLFVQSPLLSRLRDCRDRSCDASGLMVLDEVMEMVQAREWCLRWGDAPARLANLDSLREHACRLLAASTVGTPLTLLVKLQELAATQQDNKAVRLDENAVVISTWHSAKGLEWPIVVLHWQGEQKRVSGLGPQILSDAPTIRLDNPLAGRWIRYWISPYGSQVKKSMFHDRLALDVPSQELTHKSLKELRRLLYVGWTRARDRVVLVSRKGKLNDTIFGLLSENGTPLLEEILEGDGFQEATWAGMKVRVQVRRLSLTDSVAQEAKPGEAAIPAGPKDHPRAWLTPSKDATPVRATIGEPVVLGDRLKIPSNIDMHALGNAIHGFLAADRDVLTTDQRTMLAQGLIKRWELADELSSEQLLEVGTRFRQWVAAQWPVAIWHREMPIMYRLDGGSVIRGNCDLALEMPDGWVVIDHKSFPGTIADAKKEAESYAPQLFAYVDAIRAATGKDVRECFVHLSVMGIIVPILDPTQK